VTAQPEKLPPALARVARARVLLAAASAAKTSDREPRLIAARAELAKALELDPTSVEAIELQTSAPRADRVALARKAAAAHPDDPRAFRLLADLLRGSGPEAGEREGALRQAVKLDPNDPHSLNNLAWLLVEQHKAKEALPLALRAIKRAPADASIIDTYAAALFDMGRCKSAIEHEERAIELLRDSKKSSDAKALHEHLAAFKSGCAAQAAQ
jgi:tetratricopeptide (TPR) repeat protein